MENTTIEAIFSILGDNFNPETFSNLIEIKPTQTGRKGMKGSYTLYKEDFWQFSTGVKETLFLEDVLNLIYDRFSSKISQIVDFQKSNYLNIKVFAIIKIYNNDNPAIFLNKQNISFLNAIDAELDFDIYNN